MKLKQEQGVIYPNTEAAVVMDPETMKPVPHDGKNYGRNNDKRKYSNERIL